MMQGSLKLGTLAGIDIRVHYTWFFAFILIAWSLALGYFPTANAGLGAGTYGVLGVVSALLLFGSVLVHELGHSLVAGARYPRGQHHPVHLRRRLEHHQRSVHGSRRVPRRGRRPGDQPGARRAVLANRTGAPGWYGAVRGRNLSRLHKSLARRV